MTSPNLSVGIVGCGKIGTFTRVELLKTLPLGWYPLNHAEAITQTPGLELVALCDTSSENLSRAMQTFKVTHGHDRYESLIDEKPDILSIATRTPIKKEILLYAAKRGVKAIHCEKPLSNSISTTNEILSALRDSKIHLTYGVNRRFVDLYRKAKSLLREGVIGELESIELSFGRTLLLWNHPHTIDLMLYFADTCEVASIEAKSSDIRYSSPNTVDVDPTIDGAAVVFKSGVTAVLRPEDGNITILKGSSGHLIITEQENSIQWSSPNSSVKDIPVTVIMSGTQRIFHELKNAVLLNQPLSITPDEIQRNQAILMAMGFSALSNRKVTVDEIPANFTMWGHYQGNPA